MSYSRIQKSRLKVVNKVNKFHRRMDIFHKYQFLADIQSLFDGKAKNKLFASTLLLNTRIFPKFVRFAARASRLEKKYSDIILCSSIQVKAPLSLLHD